MVRTQIQLTEQQARRLKAEARQLGVSLAEVIRIYVERGLADSTSDRLASYERASRAIGRFHDHDRARDTSSRHDHYLDDAFR
jgi:hypothetical protein